MKHEQQRAIASMGQPHIVMINQQPNGAAFNPALMRTFDIPNGMMNVSGPSDATAQAMDAQIIGTIPLNEKVYYIFCGICLLIVFLTDSTSIDAASNE